MPKQKTSSSTTAPSSTLSHLLVLALITTFFFAPVLFKSRVFFFGDTLTHRVPSMVFWKSQITAGQLPLWNPYIFAGLPHLADLSTNTLSPFNIAYLFINNPFVALSYLVVFEVFLASIFTYTYLIKLKLKPAASLIGAIIYAFSGTTLAAVNDINSLQGIILMPLVLLTAHNVAKSPTLRNLVFLSLTLSFQFISSHPQYSYYTWVLTLLYLLVLSKQRLLSRLIYSAAAFALFFGLVGIQLIPFLELTSQTYRPASSEFSSQNSLQILDLPRFILANVYGTWQTGTSWGPNSPLETGRANTEGFVGLIALFASIFAITKVNNKNLKFFLGTALISFLLALGPATPLYTIVRKTLPLFNKFRSPIRVISLYTLSVSIITSYGINHILKNKKHA